MASTPQQQPPQPSQPSTNLLDPTALQNVINSMGGAGTSFIGLPTGATASGQDLEKKVLAQAPGGGAIAPGTIAPRYMTGAEYLPVMGNATPDEIYQLQQQMVSAGLLTGSFIKGYWDTASKDAFNGLLANANNAGTDYTTMLNNMQNAQTMTIDPVTGQPVVKQKGAKALTLSVTNPQDIATTAQSVALQNLGRPLSDSELQRFTSIWQSQEKGYQTAAAEDQSTGGTVTKAPTDMTGAAQQFDESIDPTAYRGQQAVGLVQHLNGLLSGITGLGQPGQAATASQLGVQK